MLTVTTTDLRGTSLRTLDEAARALQEADAAIVSASASVGTERARLGGVEAIRLTYTTIDPTTGLPEGRAIRRTVAVVGTDAVVLTFVAAATDAPAFDAVFGQIEASWRWHGTTGGSVGVN
jgi:hypothetical protein